MDHCATEFTNSTLYSQLENIKYKYVSILTITSTYKLIHINYTESQLMEIYYG